MKKYEVIIIGSGPASLGAAFHLIEKNFDLKILILEKNEISSGGLRNDCKQNYTYPIGFPTEIWTEQQANHYLEIVEQHLKPQFKSKSNLDVYKNRAQKLGVDFIDIRQAHVGTDKTALLIRELTSKLQSLGVEFLFDHFVHDVSSDFVHLFHKNGEKKIKSFGFENLIIAPGRNGFQFLQSVMDRMKVAYIDNVVDIGLRIETKEVNYSIVKDYYDPKFIFPRQVRTFCTNSGAAHVVKEKYDSYFSVNGHSFSDSHKANGLVNFALLRSIRLTDPVRSGQKFASILGQATMELGGGKPIMQRVGDFRMGRRSKAETFNQDLYDFEPTLHCSPGDLALAVPSKIMRDVWSAMKMLDTIVPGVLHPSTIMYYPEIKTYANKPEFIDEHFQVRPSIYMIGDGAGTSRGITAAWASGIRAAEGILNDS